MARKVLVTSAELEAALAGPNPPLVLVVRGVPVPPGGPRIPGAVDVSLATDMARPQTGINGNRPLPAIADLQASVRAWGLRQGQAVVVYDHDRLLVAGRGWWVMTWAGVADVKMLDGAFAAWKGPVTTEAPTPTPGDVVLTPGHLPVLDADSAGVFARENLLLDARIRVNYIGGPVAPGAAPRGHIPGSVAAPVVDTMTETGSIADAATLRHLYGAVGVDGSRAVGVTCGAGVTAALTVALLASIGVEATMYPGSWSEWSADPARPRATGATPG